MKINNHKIKIIIFLSKNNNVVLMIIMPINKN